MPHSSHGLSRIHRGSQVGSTPSSFSLQTEEIFAIAGIWESWIGNDGKIVESFALIDVHPDPTLRPYFDRIPVVVSAVHQLDWLGSQMSPLELLEPLPATELVRWKMMPYLPLPCLEASVQEYGRRIVTTFLPDGPTTRGAVTS